VEIKHKFLFSSPSNAAHSSYFVDNWLLYWHVLAAYRPTLTQEMLYRLGYVDRPRDKGITSTAPIVKPSKSMKYHSFAAKSIIRVCIFGRNGIGKRSFVWALSTMPSIHREPTLTAPFDNNDSTSIQNASIGIESKSSSNNVENDESSSSFVLQDDFELVTGGCIISSKSSSPNEAINRYLLATAVPYDLSQAWIESESSAYDLAILVFRSDWQDSLQDAMIIESHLPPTLPRIFVAMKADIIPASSTPTVSTLTSTVVDESAFSNPSSRVLDAAIAYSREEDIYDVLQLSMVNSKTVEDTFPTLLAIVQDPSRGIPLRYRNKKESRWHWTTITVAVCSGVAIAAGAYYFLRRKRSD
jgi:hypothetical protein